MYLTGILQSLGIVFITSLFNVYIKYNNAEFDIHPLLFAFSYFIATSGTLLLLAGPGKFAKETIKDLSTWIYGFTLIAGSAVDLYLINYISGSELSILSRLSIPVSIIIAFIFLSRKPSLSEYISFSVITISVIIIFALQDTQDLSKILQLTVIAGIIQAVSFIMAETHKQSTIAQSNGDLRDKARVVSFATFISTVIFFLFILFSSVIISYNSESTIAKALPFIPNASDFAHLPSILSGLLFGAILSPFTRYFQWSATYKITTENVLTVLALIPFTTFVFEYIASSLGIIEVNNSIFNTKEGYIIFGLTLFITFGAVLSTYIKSYSKIKDAEGDTFWQKIKNSSKLQAESLAIGVSEHNMADYEVIKNTIDFYEGDEVKAAKMLELPLDTVKTLSLTKNTYSLRDDVSVKVHEIFRNKIFYLDQLTGVENKKGLIRQFATYQDEGVKFNLFYMDINKFKQINDTLGHDIGDIAIITTVHRIRNYAEKNEGFTYRLGGDEFAMMTTSNKSEEQVIEEIKAIVNQPIDYDESGNKGTLNPSISIGRANVIKDAEVKIKDLIKSADENMYKDKEESRKNEVIA